MNWFAKITHDLSPNCKAALRLQSAALERPLPWRQRSGLWLHLRLCVWCARYGRQLKFLRVAAQRGEAGPVPPMPPAVRARIKRRLQSADQ